MTEGVVAELEDLVTELEEVVIDPTGTILGGTMMGEVQKSGRDTPVKVFGISVDGTSFKALGGS